MRAALYLRKSTDEHQAESLETQEAGARAFCQARGMTVARVVVDSGISRAEMVKRPGLAELQALATAGAIDAVVTRDPSRLAGDTFRGGLVVETLLDSGCRLFFYFSGREVDARDDNWKLLTAIDGITAERERKQIAGRTRESLARKAAAGHVAGGKCYGYRNVHVFEGPGTSGRKLRTEYAIHEEQAEVVRRIYQLFADGEGYRSIACRLNADGVPAPRAASWDMSTVRVILFNERYFGRLQWGRIGSEYKGGTRRVLKRDAATCVTVERPELRIVPEQLERAVAALRASNTKLYAGRSALGARQPKYLLSSLARCAECGGPICTRNTKQGSETVKAYGCQHYFTRGTAVCRVNTLRPHATVDASVLDWFTSHVVSERLLRRSFQLAREQLRRELDDGHAVADELAADLARVRGEVSRLVAALAKASAQPEAVIELIAKKEQQAAALERRLAICSGPRGSLARRLEQGEAMARARFARLRGLLEQPGAGRTALASILDGPLKLRPLQTPEGRRFEVSGRYALGPLLAIEGVAATYTECDPNGSSAVEVPQICGDFRLVA